MPDAVERLRAMLFDQGFQAFATDLLRSKGVTSLPPQFGSPGEMVLDHYRRTDPAAIGRMLVEYERFAPPPGNASPPPQSQQPPSTPQQQQSPPARPAAPPPQQRPQSKIDPQTQQRILKLLAVDKVAAQAKKMRGGSAFRQYLTPELERTAVAALKKYGAVIPEGFSAGETYLAGLSLLPEADVPLFARETRGAFGDATELRQAQSKLTAHRFADAVAAKQKAEAEYGGRKEPHPTVEPDEKAKEPTTRDVVAEALREQKARAERNGGPPPRPRRVYSKEDLERQKLKDKFFPDRARPIVLAGDVAREIANEARDVAQAEAVINGDSVSVASESGGTDNA